MATKYHAPLLADALDMAGFNMVEYWAADQLQPHAALLALGLCEQYVIPKAPRS